MAAPQSGPSALSQHSPEGALGGEAALHQTVAPATVWVSSLDGEPIERSSHLLLTHLTDVQNSGIRYADEALTILLDWGRLPHLMRRGAARIKLALDAKEGSAWRVFRLSPSGKRLGEVPFTWVPSPDLRREAALTAAEGGDLQPRSGDFTREAGLLRFTADTALDPASATYLYEIVRETAPPDRP